MNPNDRRARQTGNAICSSPESIDRRSLESRCAFGRKRPCSRSSSRNRAQVTGGFGDARQDAEELRGFLMVMAEWSSLVDLLVKGFQQPGRLFSSLQTICSRLYLDRRFQGTRSGHHQRLEGDPSMLQLAKLLKVFLLADLEAAGCIRHAFALQRQRRRDFVQASAWRESTFDHSRRRKRCDRCTFASRLNLSKVGQRAGEDDACRPQSTFGSSIVRILQARLPAKSAAASETWDPQEESPSSTAFVPHHPISAWMPREIRSRLKSVGDVAGVVTLVESPFLSCWL